MVCAQAVGTFLSVAYCRGLEIYQYIFTVFEVPRTEAVRFSAMKSGLGLIVGLKFSCCKTSEETAHIRIV